MSIEFLKFRLNKLNQRPVENQHIIRKLERRLRKLERTNEA